MRARLLFILMFSSLSLMAQSVNAQDSSDPKYPRERLFVHTARPYILAGENLYFRIYRTLGEHRAADPLSKVAYVELIDPDGDVALQSRVLMEANGGPGYLEIPVDVRSGVYTLRAYTRWMRNGAVENYYHQPVTVINTLRRLGLKEKKEGFSVELYPEGGDLTDGIPAVCGMMVRTSDGLPVQAEVVLLKDDSVQLGSTRTDEFGLSSVTLVPNTGMNISAVVLGDTLKARVPKVRPLGVVMRTEKVDGGYAVTVHSSGGKTGNVVLAVILEDRIIHSEELIPGDGSDETFIETASLPYGVSRLAVLDAEGQPLAERLVFRAPEGQLELEITPEKSYAPGEQVALNIRAGSQNADLSVSVFMWDSSMDDRRIRIGDYFWLAGELYGLTDLPEDYLSRANPEYFSRVERLLLTYGWRRYREASTSGDEMLLPEFRQPLLTGKSLKPDVPIFASMPGTDEKLFITRARQNGRFTFEIPNVRGESRMIIQSPGNSGIVVDDPFDDRDSELSEMPFTVGLQAEDFLIRANENMQISNYFSKAPDEPSAIPAPFYGKPDVSYLLDDYTRFPVMEEVFREYVYGVYVRKRNGEFYLRVLDEGGEDRFDGEPLILIDGVPVFDTDAMMELDPLRFRQIDVMRRKYGYGPVIASGIVALYSYENDLGGYQAPQSLETSYKAAQLHKEFFVPEYREGLRESRPDLRNQVFWSPSLKVQEAQSVLRFTMPDNSGTFMIVIQGMDADGNFGSVSKLLVSR